MDEEEMQVLSDVTGLIPPISIGRIFSRRKFFADSNYWDPAKHETLKTRWISAYQICRLGPFPHSYPGTLLLS
jgi:hypothetical protein